MDLADVRFGSLADICSAKRHVRFTHEGGHLFDYFICTSNDWRWNNKPECLCSLEVDDQLDLARLLDWQLGGLLTLEDTAGVDTDLPKWLRRTSSVTQ